MATEHNKIPALTEFGNAGLPDSMVDEYFLKAIAPYKISYALAWRNAGLKSDAGYEFYVPYRGQGSANNFIEFYNDEKTLFQKDVTKANLYNLR